MPEMLNGAGAVSDAVEWRLARPEDGPVWVALSREGRTPLVPREALAEPDQRPIRDRQEQRHELARFLKEPEERRGKRFLLWRASRPLGRLCFKVDQESAHLSGIALLPTLEPKVIEQVARAAVERAQEVGVRFIRAAYEARHATPFAAAGFQEVRRYTPMVAATRRVEEGEEDSVPGLLSTLYRTRPIEYADSVALTALFHDAYLEDGQTMQVRSPRDWLAETAQLLEESDNAVLPECSFIAELREGQRPGRKLLGAILVSRWQGAAVIDDLAVVPRYRRRGIGTTLVRQAMLSLRQQGYASVMLVVTEGVPAQAFYRQLGFREAQPSYVEAERALIC
jgi:ribosomal protein S18 acetylase RimI-like enzyme